MASFENPETVESAPLPDLEKGLEGFVETEPDEDEDQVVVRKIKKEPLIRPEKKYGKIRTFFRKILGKENRDRKNEIEEEERELNNWDDD